MSRCMLYIHIFLICNYNLFSLCNGICMYVFWADKNLREQGGVNGKVRREEGNYAIIISKSRKFKNFMKYLDSNVKIIKQKQYDCIIFSLKEISVVGRFPLNTNLKFN